MPNVQGVMEKGKSLVQTVMHDTITIHLSVLVFIKNGVYNLYHLEPPFMVG